MEEARGASFGVVMGRVVALTHLRGRYQIEGILPGRLRVGADAPPHASAEGREVELKDKDVAGLDFVLRFGGQVSGQVLTHEGTPIAEAEIETTVRAADNMDAPARSSRRSRSDKQGRFLVSGLGAGRLIVTARHLQFGKEVIGPSLSVGEKRDLTIRLRKPTFIAGRVRYDDGAASAAVRVRWDEHGSRPPDRLSVTTSADGSFRVRTRHAGTW